MEYFSDGVTEEIISHVSKINGIRVMSSNAVLPYKGSKPDLRKLAKELHVNYIMTGLVRMAGNTFKIMPTLIDPQTGTSLWSESYQHDLNDIFQTQSTIAIQVANMLAVEISPDSKNTIEAVPTLMPEAYNLFRKGKYITYQGYLNTHEQLDFNRAKSYFEQAIAMDPNYADPYAGLAELYDEWHNQTGDTFPDSLLQIQNKFARTAMKLNPNSILCKHRHGLDYCSLCQPEPGQYFQVCLQSISIGTE
jgi:adenylate cyclase